MAVIENGVEFYKGCVIGENEHYWLDGMLSVYAIVYDEETDTIKQIETGYYGIDCNNVSNSSHEIDCTPETARKVIKMMKKRAVVAFAKEETARKNQIVKGQDVRVIRGRKVKKGTELNVFWVGNKETYKSKMYSWMHETEEIAGCYDKAGNKVWIKTEYLKAVVPVRSFNAKERKNWIAAKVKEGVKNYRMVDLLRLARR